MVLKRTVGATDLWEHWTPGTKGKGADSLLAAVQSVHRLAAQRGYAAEFRGMLWTQGESDALTTQVCASLLQCGAPQPPHAL